MANTITMSGSFFNLTLDGTTDLTMADFASTMGIPAVEHSGLWVRSISSVLSATDDVFVIREGSTTGAIVYRHKATSTYDQAEKVFADGGVRMFPTIDATDLTLTTAGNCIIRIEIA